MLGNNTNKTQTPVQNQNIKSKSNFVQFVVFGKYDFTAEECDEITFKRGDPILVLEKDDEHKDGWWKGKTVDKMVGLFPVEFTTFINIKEINIDGLFDELDNSGNSRKGSLGTNVSSNHNLQVVNNSPPSSTSEFHTPVMHCIDRDQNNTPNSSAYSNSRRLSFSSASGTGSTSSPQVLQHPIQKPPHLSIGNPATVNQKEFHKVPPIHWTVDHVVEWLEEIGYGAFSPIFINNNINGPKLLDQSLASLREIGISQLKDRLKIYNTIVSIKEQIIKIEQENEMNASMIQNNSMMINNSIINNSMINNSIIQNNSMVQNNNMIQNNNVLHNNVYNNSIINDQSQIWHQHNRLYEDKYVIEEENDSIINDGMSVSSNGSSIIKNRRGNDFIDARNNARQINGPTGMRPRLNNMVSRESMQLTNTNFNYYRSSQRANKAPSQSSKSSISSISSFFRRLSISRPNKKNDFVFEPMFQQADYQGWLWTRFNKNTKWKKRWIILSREKVYFLKEPKHPVNIKHTIQLNINFSIQPDIHKGKTKYTFNLIDSANQQVTYFSADNHLIMMTWINVLVRATTASANRIHPLPEGKAPITRSPNIVPVVQQSPASIVGIQPIYGVNSQIMQSPGSYVYQPVQQVHQVQQMVPVQSLMRSQSMQIPNYMHQHRPSVISSRNNLSHTVSPGIQHAIVTQNVPTPMHTPIQMQHHNRRVSASPLILPQQARRQPSNPQMVPPSPLTPSESASVSLNQAVEAKEE